jgi:uronate dehydrogenase
MAIKRLLITGAGGALGSVLRRHLTGRYPHLRLSDIKGLGEAGPGEDVSVCDLGDAAAVDRLLEGVDACVHLGGQAAEGDWPTVINANIIGCINLWEAARKAGTKRILFASSNHAIGFYKRSQRIDHTAPAKPDSRYGLSKAFAEDLGLYYANKHGIACYIMRIGSCFPEPRDERMLATWLSYRDFCQLVEVGLTGDYVYETVYGASNNPRSWWDNSNAHRLGYKPQDSAEAFADKVSGIVSDNPLEELHHGGSYVAPDFSGDLNRLV